MYSSNTGDEYNLQSGKKLNYLDNLKLPEEPGYRFELLEALLVKDSPPAILH